MIYIRGDMHGKREEFEKMRPYGEGSWGAEDILIVCGDFGFVYADDPSERAFLDELEQKPYTICFCDGNHENFSALNAYPRQIWNGGRVHRIRKNIYHLMRGELFTIEGKRFFVMGGGFTRDRYMRIENRSWWQEELPSDEEYRNALATLKECRNQVDYIITHTAPRDVIVRLGRTADAGEAELTGFFGWLKGEVRYVRWFFGHWHTDRRVDSRHSAVYREILTLDGNPVNSPNVGLL